MSPTPNLHKNQPVLSDGLPLNEAQAAMILIHGRGASAYDIMELGHILGGDQYALLAPQAASSTWYPYSFLAPLANNEPYLTSALQTIASLVEQIEAAGIPAEKIVLAGFSQGACLASEFVARNARRYGGLLVFSGGLVGPPGIRATTPARLPARLSSSAAATSMLTFPWPACTKQRKRSVC